MKGFYYAGLFFIYAFLTNNSAKGQPPVIQWEQSFGGSTADVPMSVVQLPNSNYIIAGWTESSDGDVTLNHGSSDVWVVNIGATGNLLWEKCYGGSDFDFANQIYKCDAGGYFIAGYTYSNNGDVSGNHGYGDFWALRIDQSGTILWQNTLGGSSSEGASSGIQTLDGGYIMAGRTDSDDGDISFNHALFYYDYWIVKLDSSGNIEWEKSYGGTEDDEARSIAQTRDSGYVITGIAISFDGDVTANHGGGGDFWVVKIDKSGNLQWQKCYGGSNWDEANSIQQTSDGGYIVGGFTRSSDGDITFNHGISDYWIIKIDSTGTLEWQKTLGGSDNDEAGSVQQTHDGGFTITGFSGSFDGDVATNHGVGDFWLVKLDSSGNLLWQDPIGGLSADVAYNSQETNDDGFIIVGPSLSNDSLVTGNHGGTDFWIVKLGPDTITSLLENDQKFELINFSPNPVISNCTIINSTFTNSSLFVYDLTGRVLLKQPFNEKSILNVAELKAGIYIVEVRDKEGRSIKGKLMKE